MTGASSPRQTVTVANPGGAAITLQAPSLDNSADFQISANTCGSTLGAGASCTLQLIFHPSLTGNRTARLSVPGSVPGSPIIDTLSGTGLAPGAVTLSPPSASFGSIALGSSSPVTNFTVTNTGGVSIYFQSILVAGDYALTNNCSASLAPGASCALHVVFSPQSLGLRQGTLTVTSDATNSPNSSSLSGTGVAAAHIILAPASLTFPATVTGSAAASETLSATNTGGIAANLGSATLTGDYQFTSTTCGSTLAPGATCNWQIAFSPSATGDRPGTFTLPGSYPGSPGTVPLDGTGVSPGALTLTPATLQFNQVQIGASSVPQQIVISNSGGATVQLGAAAASGDYTVSSTTCSSSLAPSATCQVQIVFTPTAAGDRAGLLTVPANVAGGQATASLDGTGVAPGALAFSPGALTFAPTPVNTASPTQTLTLANSGGLPVSLQPLSTPADYQAVSTCGATLAPGATCQVQVAFRPAAAGDRPGTLTIAGAAAGQLARASLDGIGLVPATLTVSPPALAFGQLQLGKTSAPLTATISNSGGVQAQLQRVVLAGDYSIAANTCSATLAPATTCAIQLTFTPTAAGDRPGTLTLSTTDGASTAVVALDGAGTLPPALVLTPTAITFPATVQGSSAAVQNITVSNVSSGSTQMQVQIQAPTLTGDFAVTANTCAGAPLLPQHGCTLSVVFTPTASGQRTGLLTVSDGTETQTAALSGIGLANATDTLSTGALSFPLQVVGTVSDSQPITLTNSGGATLTTIGTQVTGPFIATNNCGTQLGGNLSCTIAVSYAPSAAGTETGQLIVSDALRSQTVTLAGSGALPPRAVALPSSIDFGGYALGQVSPAQVVTVTNNGVTPLQAMTAAIGSLNFAIASTTCGATLDPGAACTVNVIFTPQTIGNQAATLTLISTSLTGPFTIPLAGSGEDFTLSISGANSFVVTNGQPATYSVVATPVGASAGSITLTCSGQPAYSACTANPVSLTIAGNTTGSAIVTIATGLQTSASAPAPPGSPPAQSAPFGIRSRTWPIPAAALALLLPFVVLRGSARRAFLVLLAAAFLVLAPTACGVHASAGSGGTTGTGPPTPGRTPPGSYPINIIASFPGATRTVTVTLIVQ